MNKSEKIPAWRAVAGSLTAIAVMVAAQLAALFLGGGTNGSGESAAVGNVVSAVLYPLLALIGLKIVCNKLLCVTLSECRVTGYKIKPVWAAAAFIMPALAVGGLLLTAGHWDNTRPDSDRFHVLTGLRPGKLAGLKWTDIKDGTVYIRRSINQLGETTTGKNHNAQRNFALNIFTSSAISGATL